jgi:hypothetical protein
VRTRAVRQAGQKEWPASPYRAPTIRCAFYTRTTPALGGLQTLGTGQFTQPSEGLDLQLANALTGQ